jgi:hypothetical protein
MFAKETRSDALFVQLTPTRLKGGQARGGLKPVKGLEPGYTDVGASVATARNA